MPIKKKHERTNQSFNKKRRREMTGLAIGVSSMKSGERALLHTAWELGYGKEGSFSFLNVPPMVDLLYEVVCHVSTRRSTRGNRHTSLSGF